MNQSLIERIALHADIDTRRAMGFPPRKLKKIWLKLGTREEIWRYYPNLRKALFFSPDPEHYEFEVHDGIVFNGEYWSYTKGSQVRSLWKNLRGKYVYQESGPRPHSIRFSFAQNPEFIIE